MFNTSVSPGHDAAPLLDTLDLILDLNGDSLTTPRKRHLIKT